MLLKADRDFDNPIFNISDMRMIEAAGDDILTTYIMVFSFNVYDVKYVYTSHEYFCTTPEYVEIVFKDDKKLQVYFHPCTDEFKYPEKIINEIFKMKMLDTKWAEENPEKFI